MKYRKGIFIVVYRKEKNNLLYLILKRKLHWKGGEFPKGGIEKGEKIQKTILRELKEEIGRKPIKITNYNVKGKYKYKIKLKDRPFIGQTFSLYSAEIKSKKIKIDKVEHSAYVWKTFKEAKKMLTWKNQKKCLGIVDKFLSG